MSGLRWRLARLIAPAAIIRDPLPSKDGCAVLVREGGTTATFYPQKFRIRSRLRLRPEIWRFEPDRHFGETHRQVTTFAGVLHS